MPVELLVNSCNFYNQLKSGLNFGTPTDPTLNLAGSVGERIRMELEVDVYWYFVTSTSNSIDVTGTGTIYTRQTGSWITDGFVAGDTIGAFNTAGLGAYYTIVTINDLTITVSYISGTPWPDANYADPHLYVFGTTELTALILKFALIGNLDTFNILSKISNNEQAYYGAGIVHAGTPIINMQKVGNYSDWITGRNTLQAVEVTAQYLSAPTIGYVEAQRFSIIHQFIINPWFLEQWTNNLLDNTIPTLLAGLNSLKYVYECEFRTVLSNPNTSKTARISNNLGSVGWFNENYNGFNNNYQIVSIDYFDTTLLSSCDGIQRGARTTATITISKVSGTFNASDPDGVMISLCPVQSAYMNTTTNVEQNFLFDDVINTEGSAPVTGTNSIIKNYSSAITAGDLVITVEVEYTSAQQLLIPNNAKYIIGCQVADDTLSSGNSDKVTLLADYNSYVSSPDIEDLMYVTGFEIFQHFVTDPTATTGTTKVDLWNEDGLCFKFDFWLDLNLNALLNSLKFLVIAYDSAAEEYFILSQYAINLNNVIISGGVQQINISDLRGYKLNSTDYFNKVIVTTGANIANKQYYQLYLGQKTPWQDWIQNLGADTVFYDNSEPNNNLNYKSSNYSALNGYEIKFALLANVYGTNPLGISGNTDYLIISPDMVTYDYDLPATWTASLETLDVTGTTNLGGAIRTDADTLFRITWTKGGAFNAGYNFWAIHRIEESQESGTNIYEFSSLITSITNNLLKPVSGETFLKLTIDPVSQTVISECLVDYTTLDSTKSYKLSGRMDDGTAVPYVPIGKLTEEGSLKITEDGQVKVIE